MTLPGGIAALREAFTDGSATPVTVAERFLALPPVGGDVDAFISVDPDAVLAQAAESTRRLEEGNPRGPLEGVLVGIKDFYDVTGYVTRAGTANLVRHATSDAELVRRLRAAGAVIAGKARCTELGLSPIGINPSGGTPRNPHDPSRPAGGSSSGSAAAVAAGLVPLAVGSDGGGSLRIPPACCGVFGMKPTFGHVPSDGELVVGWWSLEQAGPVARTAADLRLGYEVLVGVQTVEPDGPLRVGVDWTWWGVPASDVDRVCRAAIDGLALKPVSLGHLDLVRVAGYVTALAEVATAMHDHLRDDPAQFGADVQAQLRAAGLITAVDYLRAQQVRTQLHHTFAQVFADVDVLVTPTTACTIPALPAAARQEGVVDESLVEQLTRYCFPANLVGLPAVTVPVGIGDDGMPIGLQLVGGRGRDDAVLALAEQLEAQGLASPPDPEVWRDPLAGH